MWWRMDLMSKKQKIRIASSVAIILIVFGAYNIGTRINLNAAFEVGEVIDSLDGVAVYYNGGVNNVTERNVSDDGYNLGLKYQCVEFVKRYYFEHFNHRMPDTFGHAKDFFNKGIKHAGFSPKRGLYQYSNGQNELPKHGDLLVLKPTIFNRFGHVSIVSKVDTKAMTIEVVQQNPGPFGESRESYMLSNDQNKWRIKSDRVLGWLRKGK